MKRSPDNTPRNPGYHFFTQRHTLNFLCLAALVCSLLLSGNSCTRVKRLAGVKDKQTNLVKIISPHDEGIRKEMQRGFVSWYKARHNKAVAIGIGEPWQGEAKKYIDMGIRIIEVGHELGVLRSAFKKAGETIRAL